MAATPSPRPGNLCIARASGPQQGTRAGCAHERARDINKSPHRPSKEASLSSSTRRLTVRVTQATSQTTRRKDPHNPMHKGSGQSGESWIQRRGGQGRRATDERRALVPRQAQHRSAVPYIYPSQLSWGHWWKGRPRDRPGRASKAGKGGTPSTTTKLDPEPPLPPPLKTPTFPAVTRVPTLDPLRTRLGAPARRLSTGLEHICPVKACARPPWRPDALCRAMEPPGQKDEGRRARYSRD
jgi:hypothetical protein